MHNYNHWLSVLFILAVVLLADLATPPALPWGEIRVKHTWNTVPANWESLGPPPASTTINLHIALEPHHESALIDALYEISDPKHQKYGAHLTKEQVAQLVAPHQDTLDTVHSWLEHHGVPSSSVSTSHGGGWLTISGVPVSQADELLCASYQLYRHTGTNETEAILRTVSYALPAALHAHVQTVAPTTHFAPPHTPLQSPHDHSSGEASSMVNATSGELVRVLSGRDGVVTPSFLRWLYKTQAYTPAALGQNVLGTLGVLNDYPAQADLTQFMTYFRADAEAASFTVVLVNNGEYDQSEPGRVNIHTQYVEALTYPTLNIFYISGGPLQWLRRRPSPGDMYLEWLNYILSQQNIPQTISIPYGIPEPGYPREYVRALCSLFGQLGARGASVLAASGDDGVGRGHCRNFHGDLKFVVKFPASCPWVTGVGGTTGQDPEVAAGFSGGGFSRHFSSIAYQADAVSTYLERLGPVKHGGLFPRTGRGVPDVAAQAHQFMYIRRAVPYLTSGTIGSTSIVAGIVSLLNDYRISTGRPPLGFLNPWLYSHGLQTSNDITSGSNPGCGTDGFSAVPGWDPVTGLGTLDFEVLQAILDYEGDDDDDDDDDDDGGDDDSH